MIYGISPEIVHFNHFNGENFRDPKLHLRTEGEGSGKGGLKGLKMAVLRRFYRLPTVLYLLFNISIGFLLVNGLHELLSRPLPSHLAQGGHFQFLTNLSLVLTILTLAINILTIVINHRWIISLNRYFNASALIAETIVTAIYWPLKLFLTNMIVNTEKLKMENFIPLKLDLTIHLLPLLTLALDYYFIRYDQFQITLVKVFSLLFSLSLAYWYILETLVDPVTNVGQEYPYPFLNVDNTSRLIIFFTVAGFGLICYQIYEYFHQVIAKIVFKLEDEAATEYTTKKES